MERGVCLVGPHRDDFVLRLGDLPAKGYAFTVSLVVRVRIRLASSRCSARTGLSRC